MSAKKIILKLLLTAVAICFTLALFEAYLRVFHSKNILGKHAYFDNNAGIFRLIPNKKLKIKYPEFEYVLKINSRGLRDYEYSYEKNKDVFRIIILGDSFAFGQGVELKDTFAKILDDKFRKYRFSSSPEVINTGVPGYSTDDCYKLLTNEAYKYKPDLVIYAFFVNDFTETFNKLKETKADSDINNESSKDDFQTTVDFDFKSLLQNSYLYHFLLNSTKKLALARNFLYTHGISKFNGPLYYLEDYVQYSYAQDAQEALGLSFDYISKMDTYLRSINSRLLVVYLPDYFQVYYKVLQADNGMFTDKQYDIDKPQRLLSDFCNSRQISYVDVTVFFRQQARLRRLYYESDQHFTKEGNNLVAEILFAKLNEFGLIE